MEEAWLSRAMPALPAAPACHQARLLRLAQVLSPASPTSNQDNLLCTQVHVQGHAMRHKAAAQVCIIAICASPPYVGTRLKGQCFLLAFCFTAGKIPSITG